jgi:hypothetical protein
MRMRRRRRRCPRCGAIEHWTRELAQIEDENMEEEERKMGKKWSHDEYPLTCPHLGERSLPDCPIS